MESVRDEVHSIYQGRANRKVLDLAHRHRPPPQLETAKGDVRKKTEVVGIDHT